MQSSRLTSKSAYTIHPSGTVEYLDSKTKLFISNEALFKKQLNAIKPLFVIVFDKVNYQLFAASNNKKLKLYEDISENYHVFTVFANDIKEVDQGLLKVKTYFSECSLEHMMIYASFLKSEITFDESKKIILKNDKRILLEHACDSLDEKASISIIHNTDSEVSNNFLEKLSLLSKKTIYSVPGPINKLGFLRIYSGNKRSLLPFFSAKSEVVCTYQKGAKVGEWMAPEIRSSL